MARYADLTAAVAAITANIRDKTPGDQVEVGEHASLLDTIAETIFDAENRGAGAYSGTIPFVERSVATGHQWFSEPILVRMGEWIVKGEVANPGGAQIYARNLRTGQEVVTPFASTIVDDHNEPAFVRREDGHWIAMQTDHNTDNVVNIRVSTNPDDPTSWEAEYTYQPTLSGGGHFCAYSNPIALPNGILGHIVRRIRADLTLNGTGLMEWISAFSYDDGATWDERINLWRSVGSRIPAGTAHNTYIKFAQHPTNPNRIDFFGSPASAWQQEWELRHGYYIHAPGTGTLYQTDGTPKATQTGGDPLEYTLVYDGSFGGGVIDPGNDLVEPMSVSHDEFGNPICLFYRSPAGDTDDKRYMEARLVDGSWVVTEITPSGAPWSAGSVSYPGIATYVPGSRGRRAIMSITESGTQGDFYEIQEWRHSDLWRKKRDITRNSSFHNVRVHAAREWIEGDGFAMTWMGAGTHTHYTNYSMKGIFHDGRGERVGEPIQHVGSTVPINRPDGSQMMLLNTQRPEYTDGLYITAGGNDFLVHSIAANDTSNPLQDALLMIPEPFCIAMFGDDAGAGSVLTLAGPNGIVNNPGGKITQGVSAPSGLVNLNRGIRFSTVNAGDHVDFGSNNFEPTTKPVTIIVAFKGLAMGALLCKGFETDQEAYINIRSSSSAPIGHLMGRLGDGVPIDSVAPVNDDALHVMILTADGTPGPSAMKMYVDGAAAITGELGATETNVANLFLGGRDDSGAAVGHPLGVEGTGPTDIFLVAMYESEIDATKATEIYNLITAT